MILIDFTHELLFQWFHEIFSLQFVYFVMWTRIDNFIISVNLMIKWCHNCLHLKSSSSLIYVLKWFMKVRYEATFSAKKWAISRTLSQRKSFSFERKINVLFNCCMDNFWKVNSTFENLWEGRIWNDWLALKLKIKNISILVC